MNFSAVRATLESVCYQPHDLMEAKRRDGIQPTRLRVDGGMVRNDWLCHYLANILDISVQRPQVSETTALGAAMLAGLQVGVYASLQDIASIWQPDRSFEQTMAPPTRDSLIANWHRAVTRIRSTT